MIHRHVVFNTFGLSIFLLITGIHSTATAMTAENQQETLIVATGQADGKLNPTGNTDTEKKEGDLYFDGDDDLFDFDFDEADELNFMAKISSVVESSPIKSIVPFKKSYNYLLDKSDLKDGEKSFFDTIKPTISSGLIVL